MQDDFDVEAPLKYLNEKDEDEWKQIEVPPEVTIKHHPHELHKMLDINDNTWACNGIELFDKGCYGGITDFYQVAGVQGWRCPDEACDFDICKACVQYTLYQQ